MGMHGYSLFPRGAGRVWRWVRAEAGRRDRTRSIGLGYSSPTQKRTSCRLKLFGTSRQKNAVNLFPYSDNIFTEKKNGKTKPNAKPYRYHRVREIKKKKKSHVHHNNHTHIPITSIEERAGKTRPPRKRKKEPYNTKPSPASPDPPSQALPPNRKPHHRRHHHHRHHSNPSSLLYT